MMMDGYRVMEQYTFMILNASRVMTRVVSVNKRVSWLMKRVGGIRLIAEPARFASSAAVRRYFTTGFATPVVFTACKVGLAAWPSKFSSRTPVLFSTSSAWVK